MQLREKLLAKGLAIDIKPFDVAIHQETDHTNGLGNVHDSHIIIFIQIMWANYYLVEEGDPSTDDISPSTKIIQFLVRDEVGALANALEIFSVSLSLC